MAVSSFFSTCTEACGWMAAIISVLSWGSFGVPIKTGLHVDVNPLVMQSLKTTVCFVTCWLVVFLGEEVRWSNWGIASGLFWVPGATCGIYGIRNAGLALSVGTWSSINVLASFFFGIVIFQEGVKDFFAASSAFLFLIIGLIGMSRYSSPDHQHEDTAAAQRHSQTSGRVVGPGARRSSSKRDIDGGKTAAAAVPNSNNGITPLEIEPLVSTTSDDESMIMGSKPLLNNHSSNTNYIDIDTKNPVNKDYVVLFGGRISLTRRQMGVLGAVINGAWGGLNLIPLHYALRDDGLTGAGFVISFASGSAIVNIFLWIFYYLYCLYNKKGNWHEAYECLPSWHLDQLLLPGLMAGMLYSTGNFASIIAVTYLGQGTGYSFCQMQLLVSGLWGVLYFREIKGKQTILKWFLSAAIAIVGIIGLSYEHESTTASHR